MGCFCSHTTAFTDAHARTHPPTVHIKHPQTHISEKWGGIFDGQNDTGLGIFVYFRLFRFQYHSTIAPYLYVYFNLLADHRLYVITLIFIQIIY